MLPWTEAHAHVVSRRHCGGRTIRGDLTLCVRLLWLPSIVAGPRILTMTIAKATLRFRRYGKTFLSHDGKQRTILQQLRIRRKRNAKRLPFGIFCDTTHYVILQWSCQLTTQLKNIVLHVTLCLPWNVLSIMLCDFQKILGWQFRMTNFSFCSQNLFIFIFSFWLFMP